MHEIRAITIDLDDTLWPIDPVIEVAERKLFDWLRVNCPKIAHSHTVETLREMRQSIASTNIRIAHDMTEVRRQSLEKVIVTEAAYPGEYVAEAMEEFHFHRNRVEFFPDAMPFLNRVNGRLPVLGLSNGNADLHRIGVSGLFTAHISAIEVGAAKPDPRVFKAACEHLGLESRSVLHIGDHPIQDILGAARIGMRTVWINRTGADWGEEHSADHEVTSLEQVLELLPLHSPGEPE